MLPYGGINGQITASIKLESAQFNGLALYGAIWNGQEEDTDVWAVLYELWKQGNEKAPKDKPAL